MLDNGRPETVYELCEMVCEAIAERPLNYQQEHWSNQFPKGSKTHDGKELCGTAYCRAGWMMSLLSSKPLPYHSDIATPARVLLDSAGIPSEDTGELFSGGAIGWAGCGDRFGSPAYVKEGIAGMRRFMDKHGAKLKAARINGDNSVTVMEKADG